MDLRELASGRYAKLLDRAGIHTVEALTRLSERELGALPGIGPKAVAEVQRVLNEAGLSLAADMWDKYECARDGQRTWDTALESIYLCDTCADAFRAGPFGGAEPVYEGAELDGYCGSCNERQTVRMCQWFLCGVCARVTKSIGRGVIAARYITGFWNEFVAAYAPEIRLVETDPPLLNRRSRQPAAGEKNADLTALAGDPASPQFAIELKSGRSSIGRGGVGSSMGRFQLDRSDCDDIVAASTSVKGIVYLFHVQVIDRAEPPTTRFAAVGFWWTHMFLMGEHFKEMTQRARENRPAAYFDVRMFQDPATFIDHVRKGEPRALTERVRREGVPRLYPS